MAPVDWPGMAPRELVGRIVVSPAFARSERLSTLLTYVCDMALTGRESEINEQKIGHAVFGRPRNYDSTIDGIVRTQASRLRQRLELYFQREGADEPMRIVIPRGGYVPIFEPRPAPSAQSLADTSGSTDNVDVPPPVVTAAGTRSEWRFLPWALCAVLACLLAVFAIRDHAPAAAGPLQAARKHSLWSHLFSAGHPTLVIAADSGLVMFNNMSASTLGLDDYLQGSYRAQPPNRPTFGPETPTSVWQANLASRRYTSMVDLDTILSLEHRANAMGSELQVRYARDLRPNELKSGNVILLGASEADPWVELFERKMNFVFQKDNTMNMFSVINRSPRRGEPAHWDSDAKDPQHHVFGLIAYLPNLAGDGDALILEGTSMAGNEGARDFVLDDSQLLPFLKQIQNPDGSVPHFELLLGTQDMSSSAIRSTSLAWRIMN